VVGCAGGCAGACGGCCALNDTSAAKSTPAPAAVTTQPDLACMTVSSLRIADLGITDYRSAICQSAILNPQS
jgi:hypothetical protein